MDPKVGKYYKILLYGGGLKENQLDLRTKQFYQESSYSQQTKHTRSLIPLIKINKLYFSQGKNNITKKKNLWLFN